MYNLRTVIGFEFSRTVRRKSFWVATLAVPMLIGIIFSIEFYSNKKAADTTDLNQKFTMEVLDESKLIPPALLKAAGALEATSKDAGIQAVKDGTVQVFIYYPAHPSKDQIQVYGSDQGIVKNEQYNTAARNLIEAGVAAGLAPEKVAIIKDSAGTTLTVYKNGQEVDDSINRILVPAVFPALFIVLIILLANQMLSSTTEEKENRVVELLLTTVSPTALIVGKIVALIAIGALQILVISIPSVVLYLRLHGSLDLSKLIYNPTQIIIGVILGVCGFLVFTGMLVAIGASVPTAKEANRFLGFAIIAMIAPVYAMAAIITSPDELIVKVFSFFPLTAPVTLMVRNALGNLSTPEALVGIIIVAVSAVLAIAIAIRSFRFGALQFTRKLTLGELFGRA